MTFPFQFLPVASLFLTAGIWDDGGTNSRKLSWGVAASSVFEGWTPKAGQLLVREIKFAIIIRFLALSIYKIARKSEKRGEANEGIRNFVG